MSDASEVSSVLATCNECGPGRTHALLGEGRREIVVDEEARVFRTEVYQLLRCAGCGSIHMQCSITGDDIVDVDSNGCDFFSTMTCRFPPAVSRQRPRWLTRLRPDAITSLVLAYESTKGRSSTDPRLRSARRRETLLQLLHEIYGALDEGNLLLAMMGTRSLLEHALQDMIGDPEDKTRGFKAKRKKAVEKGWLSKKDGEALDRLLPYAHGTVHRLDYPSLNATESVLTIVENLIERLYVHRTDVGQIPGIEHDK